MPTGDIAAVALGSNLGDRHEQLVFAREALAKQHLGPPEAFLVSSLYETAPLGCPPGSPRFLNAVILLETTQTPHELLAVLQEMEREAGRVRRSHLPNNSPRPLDLDLLYLGAHQLKTPELMLPHPRMTERLFVLEPLAELAPSAILPHTGQSVQQHLNALTALKNVRADQPTKVICEPDQWV